MLTPEILPHAMRSSGSIAAGLVEFRVGEVIDCVRISTTRLLSDSNRSGNQLSTMCQLHMADQPDLCPPRGDVALVTTAVGMATVAVSVTSYLAPGRFFEGAVIRAALPLGLYLLPDLIPKKTIGFAWIQPTQF